MEEFNIHEVAEENNLDVISTTSGKNGYPQSVKYAITGFPNFSEAEKLAEKYGLRITIGYKTSRCGWIIPIPCIQCGYRVYIDFVC